MTVANAAIKIDGLAEAQKALRKAGGTPEDQAKLNRDAIETLIVPRAKVEVPVRSGKLKGTIRAGQSTPTSGYVLAGLAPSTIYAAIVHFGWSTRGLGRTVAGTRKVKRETLRTALRQTSFSGNSSYELTSRATNKAARYATVRAGRGVVRGGPIKPNPFFYAAIDANRQNVFDRFEAQILQRAEIEGLL